MARIDEYHFANFKVRFDLLAEMISEGARNGRFECWRCGEQMSVESQQPAVTYDCLVLSGGGAKGAYGAGVAKAIEVFRAYRKLLNPMCFIGASAGALNAYLLAAGNADRLIEFWLAVTNRSLLGVTIPSAKFQGAYQWVERLFSRSHAYSIYSNKGLSNLISVNARLADLQSPLIVACTDYTQGILKAFYASPLIEQLVVKDAESPVSKRRLAHFRKIDSDEMLVKVLLASCAIPVFFPPVRISAMHEGVLEESLYVDGGVGNHTPTREAAYFFRYLEDLKLGRAGLTYCVSQDPPRIVQEGKQHLALSDILKRTTGVYDHVHTKAIVMAWKRINAEVAEQARKVSAFTEWVKRVELPEATKDEIAQQARKIFGTVGGQTARLSMPLVEIEPSSALGDALDFNPELARKNIEHGFIDTLKALRDTRDRTDPDVQDRNYLNAAEYDKFVRARIFP